MTERDNGAGLRDKSDNGTLGDAKHGFINAHQRRNVIKKKTRKGDENGFGRTKICRGQTQRYTATIK